MKPENYQGKDAIRLCCVADYVVQDGTKDPEKFIVGQTYARAPASAMHLLRQSYDQTKRLPDGTVVKTGNRLPYFVDEAARARREEALRQDMEVAKVAATEADKAATEAEKAAKQAMTKAEKVKDEAARKKATDEALKLRDEADEKAAVAARADEKAAVAEAAWKQYTDDK